MTPECGVELGAALFGKKRMSLIQPGNHSMNWHAHTDTHRHTQTHTHTQKINIQKTNRYITELQRHTKCHNMSYVFRSIFASVFVTHTHLSHSRFLPECLYRFVETKSIKLFGVTSGPVPEQNALGCI